MTRSITEALSVFDKPRRPLPDNYYLSTTSFIYKMFKLTPAEMKAFRWAAHSKGKRPPVGLVMPRGFTENTLVGFYTRIKMARIWVGQSQEVRDTLPTPIIWSNQADNYATLVAMAKHFDCDPVRVPS